MPGRAPRVLVLLQWLLIAMTPRLLAQDPAPKRPESLPAEHRISTPELLELAFGPAPITALEAMLERHRERPQAAAVAATIWRLAMRLSDADLTHRFESATLDLLGDRPGLEEFENEEAAIAQRFHADGLSAAEAQSLRRIIAVRRRRGDPSPVAERRLAHIDAEARGLPYSDVERLLGQAERERSEGRAEAAMHTLQEAAYHLYRLGRFRDGLAAYGRVRELSKTKKIGTDQLGNVWNGIGRMALETALEASTDRAERNRLIATALDAGRNALELHTVTGARQNLIRDHCLLAEANGVAGYSDVAKHHFESEYALVVEQARAAAAWGDRSQRLFAGEHHHIYEDYALFLALDPAAGDGGLRRALEVLEEGALQSAAAVRALVAEPRSGADAPPLDLERIRRRLGALRSVAVIYVAGSRRLGALVVTPEREAAVDLGPLKIATARAQEFAAVCRDAEASAAAIERSGRAAFDLLLGPLLASVDLPKRSELLVIGASPFRDMPFAALPLPERSETKRRVLVEALAVHYPSSLGAMDEEPRQKPKRALSFGAGQGFAVLPEHLSGALGTTRLEPLGEAEGEAIAVAQILGGRAVVGPAATRDAFLAQAPAADVLHFAGHALLGDDAAHCALIAAATAAGELRPITPGDIVGLDLEGSLVILSACRTAGGERFQGEVTGILSRSFQAAGAKNLVLATALVDDAAGALLIRRFAAEIARGSRPAPALASAQRALARERRTSHPALWAPWIVTGAW